VAGEGIGLLGLDDEAVAAIETHRLIILDKDPCVERRPLTLGLLQQGVADAAALTVGAYEQGGEIVVHHRHETEQIAALLERSGVDVEDVAKVSAVKLSEWQSLTKNADGEAEIHDLMGIQISPAWEEGPQWPVVQQAKPVRAVPPKAPRRRMASRTLTAA
jgi:hypothetical protein